MEKFTIKGENGFVSIRLTRVFGFPEWTSPSPFGGYDTESKIKIKCSNYYFKGLVWITTGDIFNFYKELKECRMYLKGQAKLNSCENNLLSTLKFDELGNAVLKGNFTEKHMEKNTLEFELKSNQSFINSTLKDLELLVSKYGGNKGIKLRS